MRKRIHGSENKFSPNSQLPQSWSMGSEIASLDLVKMDFDNVDPWFWEYFFYKLSNPSILVCEVWDCFCGLSKNGLWESGSMVLRINFSPNYLLPQCWLVGSEIASMDLVKMDFEKVDPWFWEYIFHEILNSLNVGPWGLRLLLWT